jgi:Rrf2 family protein
MPGVHVPAKVDYGVRALLTLADVGAPATAEALATAQDIPVKYLAAILGDLRRAGLVVSQRGPDAGYRLAKPAEQIVVGEVMRALDGPLAHVRGLRPEEATYEGPARHLQEVWVAARAALRSVLDEVTLADIVAGRLPAAVLDLSRQPDAWRPR